MPSYDFKCNTCNEIVEVNENIPPRCKTCGETMVKVWTPIAVQFKGTGFYSTGG